MSAASVTRTRLAATVSVAGLEEVMPRLQKRGPVFLHQRRNLVQFILRESAVRRHRYGFEPELRSLPLARDMNVRWFGRRSKRRRVGMGRSEEPSDSRPRFCQHFGKAAKLIRSGKRCASAADQLLGV